MRNIQYYLLPLMILFIGCSDNLTSISALDESSDAFSKRNSRACEVRVNDTTKKLLECVTVEGVRAHQAAFQAIADANNGTRVSGTAGYDASAAYVAQKLQAAGYDVTIQEFEFDTFIRQGPSALEQLVPIATVYTEFVEYLLMSYTSAGDVTAPVSAVDLDLGLGNSSTSGCEASDFAGFPAGNIALIQRGACTFLQKAQNAESAGASGVIIFNQGNVNTPNRLDPVNGTLTSSYSGELPVLSASYALGVEWAGTAGLALHMVADVFSGTALSTNVLAETRGGDPQNVVMVGGHLDAVAAGPGIQDNGSGSAAILETALKMAKVEPINKVRFAWWGAEESGLIGSTHYVNSLSAGGVDDIAMYLNFDMIGSPNFVYFIYDGDDSDGVGAGPGPDGSAEIEEMFESYYDGAGLPYKGTDFSGRSDYGPFISVGIPAGGLFTGAEGLKTPGEAAIWGGVAGEQYDPCYHLACDTYDNISLQALDVNSDAVAFATLRFAMSTEIGNSVSAKGNFQASPYSIPEKTHLTE